jgi:hypothetical protein
MQDGYGDNGYTDETTFKKGDFVGVGFVGGSLIGKGRAE